MQRNTLHPPHRLHLRLRLPRHQHPLLPRRRTRPLHHPQPLVHRILKMLRVVKPRHIVRRHIMPKVGPPRNRPVPEPGQHPRQNVHHARQPVPLVRTQLPRAAQRQQRIIVRRIRLLHNRVPFPVRQPPRLQLDAQPPRDPHLVPRHRAGRGVKHKRRLLPRRHRNGNRIRPQTRLRPESRHHRRRAAGHTDPNHIVLQRHHRVVRRHPQMPRVADGHHPHPHLRRLANGNLHRLGRGNNPQPPIRVNAGRPRRLPHDTQIRRGVNLPGGVAAHIAPQHIRNPVRIHPPQIGQHQHIRPQQRIRRRHPHLLKHRGHSGLQRLPRHHRSLIQTDPKLRQHGTPPAAQNDN